MAKPRTHATTMAYADGVAIRCNRRLGLWSVPHDDVRPTCKHCQRSLRRRDRTINAAVRDWRRRGL
jgi:hypothetical protein